MKKMNLLLLSAGLLAAGSLSASHHNGKGEHKNMSAAEMLAHHAEMLQEILKGPWRDPKNLERDAARHPAGTLAFFGVTPHSNLIEVTPGGGWYAEKAACARASDASARLSAADSGAGGLCPSARAPHSAGPALPGSECASSAPPPGARSRSVNVPELPVAALVSEMLRSANGGESGGDAHGGESYGEDASGAEQAVGGVALRPTAGVSPSSSLCDESRRGVAGGVGAGPFGGRRSTATSVGICIADSRPWCWPGAAASQNSKKN